MPQRMSPPPHTRHPLHVLIPSCAKSLHTGSLQWKLGQHHAHRSVSGSTYASPDAIKAWPGCHGRDPPSPFTAPSPTNPACTPAAAPTCGCLLCMCTWPCISLRSSIRCSSHSRHAASSATSCSAPAAGGCEPSHPRMLRVACNSHFKGPLLTASERLKLCTRRRPLQFACEAGGSNCTQKDAAEKEPAHPTSDADRTFLCPQLVHACVCEEYNAL